MYFLVSRSLLSSNAQKHNGSQAKEQPFMRARKNLHAHDVHVHSTSLEQIAFIVHAPHPQLERITRVTHCRRRWR